MTPLSEDAGFSLVETMVATFIFALVSAAGVTLLSGYQDGRLALQAADERLSTVERARALIRDDLLAAVPRTMRDAYGGQMVGFEGGAHLPDDVKFRFIRNGHMGSLLAGDRSALKRVDYIFRDQALIRRTYAHTDVTPETPVQEQRLLENIQQVEMRYEKNGNWGIEWIGDRVNTSLPNLAEMTIRLEGGRQLQFTMLVGSQS